MSTLAVSKFEWAMVKVWTFFLLVLQTYVLLNIIFEKDIISVNQFILDNNIFIEFHPFSFFFFDVKDIPTHNLLLQGLSRGGLYPWSSNNPQSNNLAPYVGEKFSFDHWQFGTTGWVVLLLKYCAVFLNPIICYSCLLKPQLSVLHVSKARVTGCTSVLLHQFMFFLCYYFSWLYGVLLSCPSPLCE
jgi:hypothetical protein